MSEKKPAKIGMNQLSSPVLRASFKIPPQLDSELTVKSPKLSKNTEFVN